MAWLVARQRGAGRAADRECRSSAPSGLDHYWVGEMEGGGGVAPPYVAALRAELDAAREREVQLLRCFHRLFKFKYGSRPYILERTTVAVATLPRCGAR